MARPGGGDLTATHSQECVYCQRKVRVSNVLTELVIDDARIKKEMEEIKDLLNQIDRKAYQLSRDTTIKVRLTSKEPLTEEVTSGNR